MDCLVEWVLMTNLAVLQDLLIAKCNFSRLPRLQSLSLIDAETLWMQGANPNAIIVSRRQQGNPLLNHIRNVRWQYGDILPDYLMGATTCAIFLSLRCVPLFLICTRPARPRSPQRLSLQDITLSAS